MKTFKTEEAQSNMFQAVQIEKQNVSHSRNDLRNSEADLNKNTVKCERGK